jgi:hypothetical protein
MKEKLNGIVLVALLSLHVVSTALIALPKFAESGEPRHLPQFVILAAVGLIGTQVWCAVHVRKHPFRVRVALALVSISFAILVLALCMPVFVS